MANIGWAAKLCASRSKPAHCWCRAVRLAGMNKRTALRAVIETAVGTGMASSIGAGVAMTTGRTAVVADGGSLLMNPAGLITAGSATDFPLMHAVLNDGAYASTGGQPMPSQRTDFTSLAAAAGYREVAAFDTIDGCTAGMRSALSGSGGPEFIHRDLATRTSRSLRGSTTGWGWHARRFSPYLRTSDAAR